MYNILICDDERPIVEALKIYLSDSEYRLLEAYDGDSAIRAVSENEVHLVLLDIMMPGRDGISALAAIRRVSNVPVILLSAKSDDSYIILWLDIGADDYITKPFKPAEVVARVRSQLRRYMQLGSGTQRPSVLVCGGIELDTEQHTVTLDGQPVALTPTEYGILSLLMQNPGRVFSPDEIYRQVWHDLPFGSENTVAVHICNLRSKLEIDPGTPRYLRVVWGQGYKIQGGRS